MSTDTESHRIEIPAEGLAHLDTAPSLSSLIHGGESPPATPRSGSGSESENAQDSPAQEPRPRPSAFLSIDGGEGKDHNNGGGMSAALPLLGSDATQLRRRHRAREQRIENAKARKARSLARWAQIRAWLKRVLPDWFTTELSLEAGKDRGRWVGVEQMLLAWHISRRAVYITAGALVALCLLWWLVLPALLGVLLGPGGGFSADQLRGSRVDRNGVLVQHPLPLCDLLYKRGKQAARGDRLSAQVSDLAAERIRVWWRNNGPPLGGAGGNRPVPDLSTVAVGSGAGTSPVLTQIPDHRQGPVWNLLVDGKALRRPLDVGYPEVLWTLDGIPAERQHRRSFLDATRRWLVDRCQRAADAPGGRDGFAAAASRYGVLELDVTDYIPRAPPAPPVPTASGAEDDSDGGGATERYQGGLLDSERQTQQALNRLLDLEDRVPLRPRARPPATPKPVPQQPAGPDTIPALPAPPPPVLRNVSIYELHVLMSYLASQAGRVRVERQTAPELEPQLGNRVVEAAASFAPVSEKPGSQQHGQQPLDPWLPIVRDQLERMDREQHPALLDLRTAVLWGGPGGCVCPHHVGVPVPGAAWFEPARPPDLLEGRAKVLFYPSSDAYRRTLAAAQAGGDDGSIAWRALSWWAGANSGRDVEADPHRQPHHHQRPAPIAWKAQDPVLGPSGPDSPAEVLKLPASALQAPWTWVEGVDYRGNKRRYRVSPRSLACVLSCTTSCGRL